MPQIIVTADAGDGGAVMMRERINVSDFESEQFGVHLVERINWAVGDAHEVETGQNRAATSASDPDRDVADKAEAEADAPADAQLLFVR